MTMSTNDSTGTSKDAQGKFAPANDLSLYYEVHGTGQPLVLLHGGLGTISMVGQLLSNLVETRQVIAVELQGHGHTADIDRPLSYEQMADDVAALIRYLGLEQADICGYSMGGGVALQTAIRHPDLVRKLVVISAACKRDGWYPEVLAGMAAMNAEAAKTWIGSPMHQAYASVAPQPENWPTLADKLSQLLKQDYDWSEAVAVLTAPTLILVGDADGIRTAHAVEMFGLLGGGKVDSTMRGGLPQSQLAVLPGTTHFTIMETGLLTPIISTFLDIPLPESK
jgi:pimeloyl-ACP methyl ester carboxylesterase